MTVPAPHFRSRGAGPGVICLHANGSSSAQWRGLTDALSADHHILAPDLYGAGRSPDWPSDSEIALRDEVDLLAPVFSQAGESCVLVGHSYGAAVALVAALTWPERVRALAIYEPTLVAAVAAQQPRPNGTEGIHAAVAASVAALEAGDLHEAAGHFIDYWMGRPQLCRDALAAPAGDRGLDAQCSALGVRTHYGADPAGGIRQAGPARALHAGWIVAGVGARGGARTDSPPAEGGGYRTCRARPHGAGHASRHHQRRNRALCRCNSHPGLTKSLTSRTNPSLRNQSGAAAAALGGSALEPEHQRARCHPRLRGTTRHLTNVCAAHYNSMKRLALAAEAPFGRTCAENESGRPMRTSAVALPFNDQSCVRIHTVSFKY